MAFVDCDASSASELRKYGKGEVLKTVCMYVCLLVYLLIYWNKKKIFFKWKASERVQIQRYNNVIYKIIIKLMGYYNNI